jgi:hypothetical protein
MRVDIVNYLWPEGTGNLGAATSRYEQVVDTGRRVTVLVLRHLYHYTGGRRGDVA